MSVFKFNLRLTFSSSLRKIAKIRMKMMEVVFVMVYNEMVMYSKLHCDRPMSRAEKAAAKATWDTYLKI